MPDILKMGRDAEAILKSEAFQYAVELAMKDYYDRWLKTDDDTEANKIRAEQKGLARAILKLEGLVANMKQELKVRENKRKSKENKNG